MSKILNLGRFAILKSEIAYVSLRNEDEKYYIDYFLKGNSMKFTIVYDKDEDRQKYAQDFINAMEGVENENKTE